MRIVAVALLFVLITGAQLANAQITERHQNFAKHLIAQWNLWVKKHGVSKGSIAIFKFKQLIASDGIKRTPRDPVPVLSLTKAVTGICIQQLQRAGKLKFTDTLIEHVPALASDVTIGALLNQTSGYRKDVTQDPSKYPGVDNEYLGEISQMELDANNGRKTDGKFRYNNSNYAMLGAVIASITGKSYEAACQELVFEPIGIKTANLNRDWHIMSSWGGWEISALDYGRFANAYFGRKDVQGVDPHQLPNVELNGGAFYGMGYMFRNGFKGGYNFWHDGKWDAIYNGKHYKMGAYWATIDTGWTIVANHNISAIKGEHGDLETYLFSPPKK